MHHIGLFQQKARSFHSTKNRVGHEIWETGLTWKGRKRYFISFPQLFLHNYHVFRTYMSMRKKEGGGVSNLFSHDVPWKNVKFFRQCQCWKSDFDALKWPGVKTHTFMHSLQTEKVLPVWRRRARSWTTCARAFWWSSDQKRALCAWSRRLNTMAHVQATQLIMLSFVERNTCGKLLILPSRCCLLAVRRRLVSLDFFFFFFFFFLFLRNVRSKHTVYLFFFLWTNTLKKKKFTK